MSFPGGINRRAENALRWGYIKVTTYCAAHANALMFVLGAGVLATGLVGVSQAEGNGIDTIKIRCAAFILLYLTEGDLGALVMVVAGISTIIASAFGAFRAAHALLVVACASFILRSLVDIWFNADMNLDPNQCASELGGGGNQIPGGG